MYVASNLSVFPGVAVVGGYFHFTNGTSTGPCQSTDLVDAAAGQLLSSGRRRDDGFRSPLESQRGDFRVVRDVPVVVVRHVISVHHFHASQPLGVINSFEAGDDQPHWETILRTQRFAILAVCHQTVVHRFRQRNAPRSFDLLRSLRNDPRHPLLHANLFKQQRQRHSGPFAATGQARRLLNCLMFGLRTVSQALDKMNAGYGRKALQLFQGELQRAVHHAVKQKAILARIDVRNNGPTVSAHKVERGWRDDAYRILKRSQYVKRKAKLIGRRSLEHGDAYRGHVMGALTIRDLILQRALYQCRCLTACGLYRTHGSRRGATF